ncbi:MAG: sporulation protein YhbH [Vulcanibacillus sp.]
MNKPLFIVSNEDWSLHRKGYEDQIRHNKKVRDAIKENLPDLISEEGIILSNGKEMLKIPVKSLIEYRFKYNFEKQKLTGQGIGDSKVGDIIAKENKGKEVKQGASEKPGYDIYEAGVTLEEIEEILFINLELPNFKNKEKENIVIKDICFNDVRKNGLTNNIDKKRTILENIKRNSIVNGKASLDKISVEDLRYKTWNDVIIPNTGAVIIAMMDTSGSMGTYEKYIARTFFFWLVRFLRTKYKDLEIVFIAHHTEAKEVTEEEFFVRGESGGTICSSAYKMALEIINAKYPPYKYNIYPFHFSDGDNLTSDNDRSLHFALELIKISNMFCYGEINQFNRESTLMNVYKNIDDEKFKYTTIRDRSQVYQTLLTFFSKEKTSNVRRSDSDE